MTRIALTVLVAGWSVLAGAPGAAAQETTSPQATPTPPPVQGAPAPSAPPQGSPAQSAPAPSAEDSRYSFHRMGDGFVRLNSRTGQSAQCGWGPTGWSCKMAPDERAALDSEIARLQRENAALKKSMLSRGLDLPSGVIAEAPVLPPVPPANIPDPSAREPKEPKPLSEAELDRAINFVKNVWRKLVDMMVDLQRDVQKKS